MINASGDALKSLPLPDWVIFDVSRRSATSSLFTQLPTYRCVAASVVTAQPQTSAQRLCS